MKNDGFFKLAVIVGAISWMAIFAFVPNILVFLASFCSTSSENFIESGFSLHNYVRLMDKTHLEILVSSLNLSGLVTLICLVTAYPFAAILARTRKPLRNVLLLLVVIPFWTNSLVRTYAMTAMLNWYRASPINVPAMDEDVASTDFLDAPFPKLTMPVLVVWGMEDRALRPSQLEGLDEHVDDLTITRIEGAGHFSPWEAPKAVTKAMSDWMATR